MPMAEKAMKERDHTQMPVAKKERPNHKCWWQMKNGSPNQSRKQLTPNERNKTAYTTSNPKRLLTCKHKMEKKKKKNHKITTV